MPPPNRAHKLHHNPLSTIMTCQGRVDSSKSPDLAKLAGSSLLMQGSTRIGRTSFQMFMKGARPLALTAVDGFLEAGSYGLIIHDPISSEALITHSHPSSPRTPQLDNKKPAVARQRSLTQSRSILTPNNLE